MEKAKAVFQPVPTGTSLGAAATCDVCIKDGNLSAVHALVGTHDDGHVYLKALGRVYFLIGVCWHCMHGLALHCTPPLRHEGTLAGGNAGTQPLGHFQSWLAPSSVHCWHASSHAHS